MKIAIMAVPERASYVADIKRRLPDAVVYEDTRHQGALISMEKILADHVSSGVLILQDDVVVPCWFLDELGKAWISDRHMSFFYRSPKQVPLYERGYSYVSVRKPWGQANYFPAEFIRAYLEWTKIGPEIVQRGGVRDTKKRYVDWDDGSVWKFMQHSKRLALLTLPNLVNHRNVKSSQGHSRSLKQEHAWVSPVFGKGLLRPWNKTVVTQLPVI
jgi:hypothetical protein